MRQNTDKKPLRFHLCVCMWVWVCVCVWMHVFLVKSGQEHKALVIMEMGNESVYICFDIFIDSGTNYHRYKLGNE